MSETLLPLWGYAITIPIAIAFAAFMLGREGWPESVLPALALIVGAFWPLFALAELYIKAVSWIAGKGRSSSAKPESK